MKEVLTYYFSNCDQASIYESELTFHFRNNFDIVFALDQIKDIDEDFLSINPIHSQSDLTESLNKVNAFTKFRIIGCEYLGWREDLTEGRSITNDMHYLIKKINSYRKNSVENFQTEIKYGHPLCPDEGTYVFSIEISEELWWDFEFTKYLLKTKIDSTVVPDFYTNYFNKNQPIKDDKSLPILSTNTKVRRIGYFKVLSLFLDDNKQIPTNKINKRFESYCLKYKDAIDNSEFNKGLIKETKNGISAKPYIEMAIDIELLNKINNILYAGKSLKVYQILKNEYSKSSNIFELTTFDKMYFLECILRYDYFYFNNLLELIYIEGKVTYSNIVREFQSKLIKSLEEYKKQNQYSFQRYKSPTYNTDRKVVNKLDNILTRIRKWEKPEVYLEHLIMPRLNWMLDFGIISFDNAKNEYNIEKIGDNLFRHLCIWNDINTEKIISPSKFLDNFIIQLFDDCFNSNIVINPDDIKSILDPINKNIENSFEIFKTIAPNRVTASQAVNYTKYKLYLEDKIKVDYNFILNQISEKEQDKFIFKYQEQYQDGYIQIKK